MEGLKNLSDYSWKQKTTDEKVKIRNQFERFQNLPETEKQSLRNAYKDFKNLPPEKQTSLMLDPTSKGSIEPR